MLLIPMWYQISVISTLLLLTLVGIIAIATPQKYKNICDIVGPSCLVLASGIITISSLILVMNAF